MTKQFITLAVQIAAITAAVVVILRLVEVDFFWIKLAIAIGVGILALSALVMALSNLRLGRSESRPDDGLSAVRAANRARMRQLLRRTRGFFADLRRAQPGHRLWYREAHSAPWWLVLGPDGHGKSTLLRAAPDAREHAPCEPDTPTREPRFFSAAGLAFVELPQDFEQHPGFAKFLALIARRRPNQPFAGVLVVTRLGDDLPADALARTRAQLVRFAGEFSVRPPVALAVTHLDRLAGFAEFCDGLGSLARPLGVTLTACDSTTAVAQVLRARLAEPLVWVRQRCHALIARPRDNTQQSNLYSFWQQFEELAQRAVTAASFLAAQPLPGGEPLRPRAVYFLSAESGLSSTDAWLERLAQRCGGTLPSVPLSAPTPAQAFVAGLFTTELRRDSPLAARLRLFRWRRATLQAIVAVAIAGFSLNASLSILRTAEAQHAHMQGTWDAAGDALRIHPRKPTAASTLAALREQVLPWGDEPSLIASWGLHRGDLLREASARVYTHAVCAGVLVPLAKRSERAMRDFTALFTNGIPGAREQAKIRDHLHLYALLSEPEGHDPWRSEESSWLSEELRRRWAEDDTSSDEARAAVLRAHAELVPGSVIAVRDALDPCIGSGGALALHYDRQLVDETSKILARVPREAGVIDRIVTEVNNSRSISNVSLQRPRVEAKVTVPAAFTSQGWNHVARAIGREVSGQQGSLWYLSDDSSADNRHEYCIRLRNHYVDRYNDVWDRAIGSLRIPRASSIDELGEILRVLINQKPLDEIFAEIDRHTQRLPPIYCPAVSEDPLSWCAKTAQSYFTPPAEPVLPGRRNSRDVRDKFAHLVDVAITPPNPKGGEAAGPPARLPLLNYNAQLVQLSKTLLEARQNTERLDGLTEAARTALGELRQQVGNGAFDPWDQAIVMFLRPPLDDMIMFGDKSFLSKASKAWCVAVVEPMKQLLLGRYPFEPDVRTPAELADVAMLFHPTTGAIAKYRDEQLSGFLDIGTSSITARPLGADANRHLNDSIVAFLDDALKLGRLLFPNESDTPSLDLTFLSTCRAEVSKLVLSVDGTEAPYKCGPDRERAVHWPGGKDSASAGVAPKPGDKSHTGATLIAHGQGTHDEVFGNGAFGLFELLEKGSPKRVPGRHLTEVTFNFSKYGPVRLTFNPTIVQGGSLFYGFGDHPNFLAPMRTPHLRNPPEQLFRELAFACGSTP